MRYRSTKGVTDTVDFRTAVLRSQPSDDGLYMPLTIPSFSESLCNSISELTQQELAFEILYPFVGNSIPRHIFREIVNDAFDVPIPLITLDDPLSILELFHGKTASFKDFGGKFIAQLFHWFNREENSPLDILVATSGDTGAAIAAHTANREGIRTTILYPKDRITPYQQGQITQFGENIRSIEINGTFDDCQHLVKTAFTDSELNTRLNLTSANSINTGRLLAQIPLWYEIIRQRKQKTPLTVIVPSGNLGNLTAGLIARKMGAPINTIVAATNANNIFPHYLNTASWLPKKAIQTLSNAMDVGNPSNFARIKDLYGSTWNTIKREILSLSISDKQSLLAINQLHATTGYICDPHTSCAYSAFIQMEKQPKAHTTLLATAHPIKFANLPIDAYQYLKIQKNKNADHDTRPSQVLQPDFSELKEWLLSH